MGSWFPVVGSSMDIIALLLLDGYERMHWLKDFLKIDISLPLVLALNEISLQFLKCEEAVYFVAGLSP